MKRLAIVLIGLIFLAAGSAMAQDRAIYLPDIEATVTVPADVVTISVSVQSTNNNSAVAAKENSDLLNKTMDSLTATGVNKDDISSGQSTGVMSGQFSSTVCNTINNSTICKTDKNSNYVLTSTKLIRLKTTDQSFVNKVLRTAQSTGASAEVYGYSLSDPSSAESQARDKAMANAKSNAERIAAQAGANLGDVQNVVSHGEYISNSDQLGMVDVTSVIDVSYALK